MGPRGSYMKDNRSTPNKPQSVSVAQVPNESLTNLGSPLGPDLLAVLLMIALLMLEASLLKPRVT